MYRYTISAAALAVAVRAAPQSLSATPTSSPVASVDCNGKQYVYQQLAGYGAVPGDAVDKYGDTLGGIGSSGAIGNWRRFNSSYYTGRLYALPDRGYNTQGTLNYQPRVHLFDIEFRPDTTSTPAQPGSQNLKLTYRDSILLKGPDGTPATGLDADPTDVFKYRGFPDLPVANYVGDGFGGAGPGGRRVSLDTEGIVLAEDNNFWISDEYGPYIYKFDRSGRMTAAIRPPPAVIPIRNGAESFSSNNPPFYNQNASLVPNPTDPTVGRQNNQGTEGLTWSPDGQFLYGLVQSALRQDGGAGGSSATRRYTRLLKYKIANGLGKKNQVTPSLVGEYVVPLPTFTAANGKTRVAAQSELHFISDTQFFFLPRDSGNGQGLGPIGTTNNTQSIYRHIDIFDISNATNIANGIFDAQGAAVAPGGTLALDIVPATVCPFIDFNINDQLARFGLHNGGVQDSGLLNEKWEAIALATVNGGRPQQGADFNNEYFVFSLSDNDFITQRGSANGGLYSYSDPSKANLDNQVLVFKATLPAGTFPLIN